ncbi:protein ROOT HAIR DEFECTIVE 3-like [Impatiens glandulifera]|uniref:protein ROOT HAIR DEFECTIVE 3-like n=1 Tax=Impatiens glandulifera TaxID=253017 RepID=UPI001FB18450|nr:protein ROOT HAIR DEFECTIVE 3-like [Impatiens glandulifera]
MSGSSSSSSSSYSTSTHLIDGEGKFNRSGLESLTENAKLYQSVKSYKVISIMGPQSSGKSTLLNHMFHTNFVEMDATKDRSQTTLGIWLEKCVNVEPCTLVMDLKGNDGTESSHIDTFFEKQIALFALAVSDVVLVNMWCEDVERKNTTNKSLLRTVFQVMMRFFKPRQTTLLFVLRDKTKTPFTKLEEILKKDTLEIWNSILKPQSLEETPFSKFFNISVVSLSSYKEENEAYLKEVSELKEKLTSGEMSSDESLGFSISTFEQIWKTIRDNKDLNIPPPTEWCELSDANRTTNSVPGFGNKVSSLIDACLSQYDEDAQLYEDDIRKERRKMLVDNLMLSIKPAYYSSLQVIITGKVKEFKDAFDNDLKCGKSFCDAVDNCIDRYSSLLDKAFEDISIPEGNLDSSLEKKKFMNEVYAIVGQARGGKMNDLIHELYKEKLRDATREPLEAILGYPWSQTWPNIRELLATQSKEIADDYYQAMSRYGAEQETSLDDIQTQFQGYLRQIIVAKAKTEAPKVTNLMQDRFITMFLQDPDSMPRSWDADNIDINKIIRIAKTQSLKMLAVMAAIRLESENGDQIEDTLSMAFLGDEDDHEHPSYGALASTTWNGISKEDTLLSPIKCASMWKHFLTKINQITGLAKTTVKKAKREAQVNDALPSSQISIVAATGADANAVNQINVQEAGKCDKAVAKMEKKKNNTNRKTQDEETQ